MAEVAEKAKATLPECNGRVDAAVKLVLAGDVELREDGKAHVASQSNGQTVYQVVNGECSCKDFPKAPQGFCKHRLSAAIAKRAHELAKQHLSQLNTTTNSNGHLPATQPPTQPIPDAPAATPALALPEAPASVNCHVTIAGRKVQVTLRDSHEQRLLARLDAVLQRFPAAADHAEPEPQEGWCRTHGVQMKRQHNERGTWWSHKTTAGWCRGK